MEKKYTLGIDFGSLSGRAVLADVRNGAELASAVMDYPHAVMDRVLAKTGAPLPPDFALQDPADYLLVAGTVIPEALRQAGVSPSEVAGVCVDFTCCTVLPLDKNGTPLSMLPEFEREPHAYAKLWKHHAATPYADRMNEVARARGEKFLLSCGGAVSSEWLFPKIYETLDKAPAVYAAADSFMEAGDYLAFMLTGVRRRGYLYAAYKAQYDKKDGYPSEDYFAAVDRRLTHVVRDKLRDPVIMSGTPVGTVTLEAAERFGLAQLHHFAVGQNHSHGQHIVSRHAVFHRTHTAGVGRHIAAHGGRLFAGIRRIHQTVSQGVRRQIAEQHAGLGMYHQVIHVVGEDLVHPLRAEHNAAVDGHAAAHKAGSRAPDRHRNFVFMAELHDGRDLLGGLHQTHRLRHIPAVDGHLVVGIGFLHGLPILKALFPQQAAQLRRQHWA